MLHVLTGQSIYHTSIKQAVQRMSDGALASAAVPVDRRNANWLRAVHAGMICVCSTAREMGLDTSDLPMHIYGPPGLAEYIRRVAFPPHATAGPTHAAPLQQQLST